MEQRRREYLDNKRVRKDIKDKGLGSLGGIPTLIKKHKKNKNLSRLRSNSGDTTGSSRGLLLSGSLSDRNTLSQDSD